MAEYYLDKRKILFNADFEPSIDFFPKQYDLMKELRTDFNNWELDGFSFTMQDMENNCSSTFTHNKIVYEFENANDKINFAKDRIIKGLNIYNKHLSIASFSRIGVRLFSFVPMQEIKKEELADIIKTKLFVFNEPLGEIFPEKINDLAYVRYYSKDEFNYHLKCGPMPKEQIPAWVNFGKIEQKFKSSMDFKEYFETFPEISIFIDIDCYNFKIDPKNLEINVKKAFDNCIQSATKLKKYILGE